MLDVLIIGGDSMIGHALAQKLEVSGVTVAATSRRHDRGPKDIFLDLAEPKEAWPTLPQAKVWVFVAAIARLAACRKDPQASYRVNVSAVEALLSCAAAQKARSVFLSSDQVFDGHQPHRSEDDPTCPRSEYGRQKATSEKIVHMASKENLIIRLTKVLAPNDDLFVSWRDALSRGEQISPFTDKTFAPVSLSTVVDGIVAAIQQKISGTLQFSGPTDTTYAKAAYDFASIAHARPELVAPVASADLGIPPEERPAFTSLDTRRARRLLNIEFAAPKDLIAQIANTPKYQQG